jgi:Uma2 family endonuclease
MTTALAADYYVSPEDYFVAERLADQRHEYVAGAIYARADSNANHDRIAGGILLNLMNQVSGMRCEVFSSQIKVRIRKDAAEFCYYPDVIVDCSNPAQDSFFSDEPRVIFEVLSPDTERIDRGEKLRNYQSIPSLDVYALVDQFHIAVTVYRRGNGDWTMEFLTEKEDILKLSEIECALPMTAIYERTHLVR